jgi:zinc protease
MHLDEHCHFLNTQHFPVKNTWTRAVEQDGARYNASTSNEVIQHELSFNREDLPRMLAMHAESVLRPTYNPTDIAQEKTNVINEMGLRMNLPENRVHSKLTELLFDRPDFQALGRQADVQQTSATELQAVHHQCYTPTNLITVVSGRVDPQTILSIAEREFGSNPPRVGVNVPPNRIALKPGEVRHATVTDPQLTYSHINLAFPAPGRTHFRDRLAMEFLTVLLSGTSTALLPSEVQNKARLVSSIDAGFVPGKAAGSLEIAMQTDPGREQQALAGTLQTITTLSQYMVSPDKLAEVRSILETRFKSAMRDVETATMVQGEEALSNSLPYLMNYTQWLNQITPDDLMRVARQYLNPATYAVVFGVPPKRAESSSALGGPQR